jgi:hypothetical protein
MQYQAANLPSRSARSGSSHSGGLLRHQGRPADAAACLQPIHDRFTEGFATADLIPGVEMTDSSSSSPRHAGRRPGSHDFPDHSEGKSWMPTSVGMTVT